MADDSTDAVPDYTGAMVCLIPSSEVARALALEGGEAPDAIHLTLAYLPDVAGEDLDLLRKTVEEFAAGEEPFRGVTNGFGVFLAGHTGTPVTWAGVDSADLPEFRQELVEALGRAGLTYATNHASFTPHFTLAYADRRTEVGSESLDLDFRQVWVVAATDERWSYDLTGEPDSAGNQVALDANTTSMATTSFTIKGADVGLVNSLIATASTYPGTTTVSVPAFIPSLTVPDYTYGTGTTGQIWIQPNSGGSIKMFTPAITVEKSAANPWYLTVDAALVGSGEPNRNGALWTAGDLEFGLPTVPNGPLNWMHEGRAVVGTLTAAQLIGTDDLTDADRAIGRKDPYIRTQAVMWSWLYPDEAEVVQMAGELGKLWISMECISENVVCAAADCGRTFPYNQFTRGSSCEHMAARGAVRRFQNPTFLGAGLILPPARPGWAQADVQLRHAAAAIAEDTFDISPDLSPEDWEKTMVSILQSLD